MNKRESFLSRNLSVMALVVVYICTVLYHISSDSFILGNQLGLLIIFLPFALMGLALDYIVRSNKTLNKGLGILARILPLSIIFLWLPNSILMNYNENIIVKYYFYYVGYVVWLFIALPFFIAGFSKEGFRHKTIRSLSGTAAFAVFYIYLVTKSGYLDRGAGFVIILLSYFFMFYAISGIKMLDLAAPLIGLANALVLFMYYKFPGTENRFNWDSDINLKIDILMLITFLVCIIIKIYGTYSANKAAAQN
jgi:hypothetical protein